MNNWNGANFWYQRWQHHMALMEAGFNSEATQRFAAIYQKEYVCYLAQEQMGAKK